MWGFQAESYFVCTRKCCLHWLVHQKWSSIKKFLAGTCNYLVCTRKSLLGKSVSRARKVSLVWPNMMKLFSYSYSWMQQSPPTYRHLFSNNEKKLKVIPDSWYCTQESVLPHTKCVLVRSRTHTHCSAFCLCLCLPCGATFKLCCLQNHTVYVVVYILYWLHYYYRSHFSAKTDTSIFWMTWHFKKSTSDY